MLQKCFFVICFFCVGFIFAQQEISVDSLDTKYREEFLSAFKLKKWEGDKIEKAFDYIYPIVESELRKHGLIEYVKNNSPFPFGLNDQTTLVLFFSFENFYLFHKCLQDFSKNKSFDTENVELLKKSILKNNM